VDPDATEDELKKQYRRLSILLHPDKNPDNRDMATNAFEVRDVIKISDVIKKVGIMTSSRFQLATPLTIFPGQVVNKANKLLKEKETLDKFKLILADAKNRVIKMVGVIDHTASSRLFRVFITKF